MQKPINAIVNKTKTASVIEIIMLMYIRVYALSCDVNNMGSGGAWKEAKVKIGADWKIQNRLNYDGLCETERLLQDH